MTENDTFTMQAANEIELEQVRGGGFWETAAVFVGETAAIVLTCGMYSPNPANLIAAYAS